MMVGNLESDDVVRFDSMILNERASSHLEYDIGVAFDSSLISGLDVSCQGLFYWTKQSSQTRAIHPCKTQSLHPCKTQPDWWGLPGLFGGKCWTCDVSCTLGIIQVNLGKRVQLVWDSSRDERLSMLYNADNWWHIKDLERPFRYAKRGATFQFRDAPKVAPIQGMQWTWISCLIET